MVGVGHAVDIGEMAVFEPDLLGLFVHQVDKSLLAAGETLGENDAGVVAGFDDHAVQQIIDADLAVERHEHLRLFVPQTLPPRLFADRQFVGELGLPLFQHVEDHIGRHDLAHRRRRDALVGTLVEQHRTGLDLQDQRVLRLRLDPYGWVGRRFNDRSAPSAWI